MGDLRAILLNPFEVKVVDLWHYPTKNNLTRMYFHVVKKTPAPNYLHHSRVPV
jgi:hypothetical protein